jgi:hypothetical protein
MVAVESGIFELDEVDDTLFLFLIVAIDSGSVVFEEDEEVLFFIFYTMSMVEIEVGIFITAAR